jgi:hypothetical protein
MEPTRPHHDETWQREPDMWTAREVRAEARADASRSAAASIPFVVQAGESLLMVEAGDDGWTVAALRFDLASCSFRESWRATYAWPREAFGVLLSRLAGTVADEEAVAGLTEEFSAWLGSRFSHGRCNGRVSC